ncbi:MAG: Alkaline shock protein 23, partial [uncultured Rubrobacteraceae bacterium]
GGDPVKPARRRYPSPKRPGDDDYKRCRSRQHRQPGGSGSVGCRVTGRHRTRGRQHTGRQLIDYGRALRQGHRKLQGHPRGLRRGRRDAGGGGSDDNSPLRPVYTRDNPENAGRRDTARREPYRPSGNRSQYYRQGHLLPEPAAAI